MAPEHFAERHGLIILIALGESMIAIGVGAGFGLGTGAMAAIFARGRLMRARGLELHRLALHSYSYRHLPMFAGIVLFAFGLETTLHHVGEALDTVPAVGLCGSAALYLLGHIAFLLRTTGRVFRRRTVGVIVLLALIPAAIAIPALAGLALVSAVWLVRGGIRGAPLSRGPSPGQAPGACGLTDECPRGAASG